jgi:hypothetical protein
LEDRYSGSKLLKVNLKTNDLHKAAQQVERLNQQHEAQWELMRGNRALTPANVHDQALSEHRKQRWLAPCKPGGC